MRLLVLLVLTATACDSGKPTTAPEPAPSKSPPAPAAADAAAADPWNGPEPTAPAPNAPDPSVPVAPPPHDSVPSSSDPLVKNLQAMRRSKKGPGLCLAPGVDKSCKADADCAISSVITDQCRTTYRIGVNVNAKAALDARLVDPCAGQNCPSCVVRWMITEDCDDSGDAAVSCLKGRCTTRNVPR